MKLLENNTVRLALIAGLAIFAFYYLQPVPILEKMEDEEQDEEEIPEPMMPSSMPELTNTESSPAIAPEPLDTEFSAEDLLPKDSNSEEFSKLNPSGSGPLDNKNFLTSGFHIGINTIGTSLRNANTGIRSEPPNPSDALSPWNNTTITADINRKGFELGGC